MHKVFSERQCTCTEMQKVEEGRMGWKKRTMLLRAMGSWPGVGLLEELKGPAPRVLGNWKRENNVGQLGQKEKQSQNLQTKQNKNKTNIGFPKVTRMAWILLQTSLLLTDGEFLPPDEQT